MYKIKHVLEADTRRSKDYSQHSWASKPCEACTRNQYNFRRLVDSDCFELLLRIWKVTCRTGNLGKTVSCHQELEGFHCDSEWRSEIKKNVSTQPAIILTQHLTIFAWLLWNSKSSSPGKCDGYDDISRCKNELWRRIVSVRKIELYPFNWPHAKPTRLRLEHTFRWVSIYLSSFSIGFCFWWPGEFGWS
jgi:hypothetical protein